MKLPSEWPRLLPRVPKNAKTDPGIERSLKHRFLWRIGSSVVIPLIGFTSKLWVSCFNKLHVQNHKVYLDTVAKHYEKKSYPLLTVCNHSSCLDDPGLMSALFPWSWNLSAARHRWSAAAEDICFTKPWHTFFFSLGKTFPVVRGLGIHQPAMDFALELLKCNEFLHIFPQGRVVEDPDLDLDLNGLSKLPINEQVKQVTLRDGDFNKDYQLKWGIARVILDYLSTNPSPEKHILILPFFHIGMHHVLPNVEPYVPRTGNTVTVSVREAGPIKFDLKFLNALFKNDEISTKEQRSRIMAYIEYELKMLKLSTMKYRHAILDDSTKR